MQDNLPNWFHMVINELGDLDSHWDCVGLGFVLF